MGIAEVGKNSIDFDLSESQLRHLMRVGVFVREVGRVIRTVQLRRYVADAPLRRRVAVATNKVESFNRFSQWFDETACETAWRPCARRRSWR
ncbi:Tn3 family transposase [Streptomyces abikoensis]|uniref:Tn3 family transposase n=1 Tax=Streptomyces abikoensis TaxID=97398 RepID=UPI0036BF6577